MLGTKYESMHAEGSLRRGLLHKTQTTKCSHCSKIKVWQPKTQTHDQTLLYIIKLVHRAANSIFCTMVALYVFIF
ncbi:hypothetical protein BpHYR1_037503 [Brachionus plicatilis]|uniref:Uncharacterized protein n=1 Tax=Brachionus plicatilis TaxID=10195 RepID=A0A3M7PH30_BRAPC|nr:hypothetical protein BpHYR1_037503 [Brachionus plicatilis]